MGWLSEFQDCLSGPRVYYYIGNNVWQCASWDSNVECDTKSKFVSCCSLAFFLCMPFSRSEEDPGVSWAVIGDALVQPNSVVCHHLRRMVEGGFFRHRRVPFHVVMEGTLPLPVTRWSRLRPRVPTAQLHLHRIVQMQHSGEEDWKMEIRSAVGLQQHRFPKIRDLHQWKA